jgi:hypothetical protein
MLRVTSCWSLGGFQHPSLFCFLFWRCAQKKASKQCRVLTKKHSRWSPAVPHEINFNPSGDWLPPLMLVVANMRQLFQFLHHRSLTVSVIALIVGFFALAFLPEHRGRLQQQGATFLTQAALTAALGLLCDAFTLVILLRDNRSGYPAFRCSLAALLWALACFPVLFLTVMVIAGIWK